jgi:hypothetical protein
MFGLLAGAAVLFIPGVGALLGHPVAKQQSWTGTSRTCRGNSPSTCFACASSRWTGRAFSAGAPLSPRMRSTASKGGVVYLSVPGDASIKEV